MLILVCGLPNAGKTTYANEHYEFVIHYDLVEHITLEEHYRNCIQEVLNSDKQDICVEGVYDKKYRRMDLIQACEKQDKKICIWINTPYDICLSRRDKPKFIVEKFYQSFEPPSFDEGWDEIIEVNDCY